ncbi:MAG: outer membrane beta-barrel protein [Burkholderiaceae bacterium]|nr:outer membrane beta-barrel protein [Burkholderiaceae bacterium]
MKMKWSLIFIAGLSLAAQAQDSTTTAHGNYVSLRAQSAQLRIADQKPYSPRAISIINGPDTSDKTSGSLAVGRYLPNAWRVEAEYSTRTKSEFDTLWQWTGGESRNVVQASAQRLMLNAYKDFPVAEALSLYAGAGVGISNIRAAGYQGTTLRTFDKHTQNNFAYGLTVGMGYRLNQVFTVGLGYRYVGLGETQTGINNFINRSGTKDEHHEGKLNEQNAFLELRARF